MCIITLDNLSDCICLVFPVRVATLEGVTAKNNLSETFRSFSIFFLLSSSLIEMPSDDNVQV